MKVHIKLIKTMAKRKRAPIILSTDTLSWYWLDHIFDIAKQANYEGLDLATWKNFDARNVSYVQKLVKIHELPIEVVQVSHRVNSKELQQAFELCNELGVTTLSINAPMTLDFKTYNFLVNNIRHYKHEGVKINFAIINPNDSNLFALPIPRYRFGNIAEIVKKYHSMIGLDVANLNEEILEIHFIPKIKAFIPHIAVIYFSDKSKRGEDHIAPWDGILKLPKLLSELKKNNYTEPISVKLNIEKKYLSDNQKVLLILQKAHKYLTDFYINA